MAIALRAAAAGRAPFGAALAQRVQGVIDTVTTWRQRAVTRHELARLDTRMLRDIGITHVDVELEAGKPFWRA